MRFSHLSLGLAVLASVVTGTSNQPGNMPSGDRSQLAPLNTNNRYSDTSTNEEGSVGSSSSATSLNSNVDIAALLKGLSPEDKAIALRGALKALKTVCTFPPLPSHNISFFYLLLSYILTVLIFYREIEEQAVR